MRGMQLLVVALCGVASAKPLPPGLKVTLTKKAVVVSRDGVSVPLMPGEFGKLVSAELSADGKSIVVKAKCADEDDPPDEIALATVEAQLDNMVGMSFHNKKSYDEAIKRFTIAAQKDPATAMYATNLLSAQSMSGKLDDADKTIATLGKRNPAWFAWRLAVDPEL